MFDYFDVSIIIYSIGPNDNIARCVRSSLAQSLPGRSMQLILSSFSGERLPVALLNSNRVDVQIVETHKDCNDSKDWLNTSLQQTTSHFVIFLNGNDFVRNYMFFIQLLYLYDHKKSMAASVDHWLVAPNGDEKLKKGSFRRDPYLSGVMWRKDFLDANPEVLAQFEPLHNYILPDALMKEIKIGEIPISFLRHSQ